MPLTRNALKHKKVRSVACGPAGAGWLEGLLVEQDANCDRLVAAGNGQHIQRLASSALPRVAPFHQGGAGCCPRGINTTSTMWRTVGAVPFNSQVVFRAQAELHAAYAAALAKEGAVRS